ncbi:hypothetical protein SUGI_0328800 [Cryptomeria japonica]|nr:hypothetical protein SUGI_0328800 [Cryptomeria japonica]
MELWYKRTSYQWGLRTMAIAMKIWLQLSCQEMIDTVFYSEPPSVKFMGPISFDAMPNGAFISESYLTLDGDLLSFDAICSEEHIFLALKLFNSTLNRRNYCILYVKKGIYASALAIYVEYYCKY